MSPSLKNQVSVQQKSRLDSTIRFSLVAFKSLHRAEIFLYLVHLLPVHPRMTTLNVTTPLPPKDVDPTKNQAENLDLTERVRRRGRQSLDSSFTHGHTSYVGLNRILDITKFLCSFYLEWDDAITPELFGVFIF